jgi:hypothetical protein
LIADRMFDRLDENHDGSISKEEFKKSFERRRGAPRGEDSVRRGRERSSGPRSEGRRSWDRLEGPRMSGRGFRGPSGPPSYRQGGREWRGGPWGGGDRMARGPVPRYYGGPPRSWGDMQPRGADFRRGGGPPWYRAGSPPRGPRARAEGRPGGPRPEPRRADGPRSWRQGGPGGRGEWTPPGPDGPRGRRGGRSWRGAGASTERSDPSSGAASGLLSGERGDQTPTEEPTEPSNIARDESDPVGDVVPTKLVPRNGETERELTR